MACDIGNIYLDAPCRKMIWFAAGPEHGTEKTYKAMVIIRNLNGLNNSSVAWRIISAETLLNMYFMLTVANPENYCRRARNPNDEDYYEFYKYMWMMYSAVSTIQR